MNKYGQTADKTVELYSTYNDPKQAWQEAARSIFPESVSSQKKGCPKTTFLGLCEEGLVKGIPSGNYTRSQKNKEYGIQAINYLLTNPNRVIDISALWLNVTNGTKIKYNSQLHVVVALWENGLIKLPKE